MASHNTDMTCLMCLEPKDVLKLVGKCNHSFCVTCLVKHLESSKDSDGTFPCPTCRATCELPDGDVEKLDDLTGASMADVGAGARPKVRNPAGSPIKKDRSAEMEKLVDVKCLICFHSKKEVKAKNLCPQCGHLYLCDHCTAVHAKSKATKDHTVIPLVSQVEEEEEMCPTHDTLLTTYCTDCGKAACNVCVMLEHADHNVEKLTDTIEKQFTAVKIAFKQREVEVTELKCLANKLGMLKNVARMVDKQDELVKEIEDHAQKRIDEIVTWKENMKREVRDKFKVVRDIPETYDKAKDILKKLETPLPKVSKLLENRSNSPSYLDRLTSLEKDLDAVPKIESEIDGEGYRRLLREVHQHNITFSPSAQPLDIGKIKAQEVTQSYIGSGITTMSSCKIDVDAKDKFIPCIVNLGKKFAIADPTLDGTLSNAIHIYEPPNKLCQTLRDGVDCVYDMAATSEGNLAVLSNGTDGTVPSSLKIYDPDLGDRLAVHNLDVPRPIALAVSPENHSFILGKLDEGRRCITVVNDKGDKQYEHIMEVNPKVKDPSRISCGCWYVFVMGENGVGVYERQDKGLKQVHVLTTWIDHATFHPKYISASVWDDLFFTVFFDNGETYLLKYQNECNENEKKWGNHFKTIKSKSSGADVECRVSVNGGQILLSQGQTFSVRDWF